MVLVNRVAGSSPSYKHCLAMLGQYLNQQHARLATVAEVDNGFLLFYYPDGRYQQQRTLMVPHVDLLELNGVFARAARGRKGGILQGGANRDRRHPLLPQGYDTVFRALGHKLDQRQAVCATICETKDTLYLDYWVDKATFVIRDQRRQAVSHHQGETYDAAGVTRMIDLIKDGLTQESNRHLVGLRVNPHDHISSLAAAFLLEDEGNYRDAESFFRRITTQVPQHAEAQYHLARLAYIRSDQHTAQQALKRALSLRPDVGAYHDLHGRILLHRRAFKDAGAALERATALDPENPIMHQHLAQAYEAQGRKEDAAQEMMFVGRPQAAPAWDMVRENLLGDLPLTTDSNEPTSPSGEPMAQAPTLRHGSRSILPNDALLPPLPTEAHDETDDQASEPAAWMQSVPDAAASLAAHAEPSMPENRPLTTVLDMASAWSTEGTPGADLPSSADVDVSQELPRLTVFPTDPPEAPLDPAPTTFPAAAQAAAPEPNMATLAQRLGALRIGGMETTSTSEAFAVPAAGTSAPGGDAPPPSRELDAPPSLPITSFPDAASGNGAATDAWSPDAGNRVPHAGQPSGVEHAAPGSGAQPAPGAVELAAEILTVQRALAAEPGRADLHRKLGFLLARQGRAAEAATEFRKALQHSRTSL